MIHTIQNTNTNTQGKEVPHHNNITKDTRNIKTVLDTFKPNVREGFD